MVVFTLSLTYKDIILFTFKKDIHIVNKNKFIFVNESLSLVNILIYHLNITICLTMACTAVGRFNFITAMGAISLQEEHSHCVYFAAGTASASLARQGVRRRCPQRAILAGGHLVRSLCGLRTRAVCSRDEQDAF